MSYCTLTAAIHHGERPRIWSWVCRCTCYAASHWTRFISSVISSVSLSLSLSINISLLSRKIFVGGLHYETAEGAFFLLLSCAVRIYTVYRIGTRFLRLCRWSRELLLRFRWSHVVLCKARRGNQELKVREALYWKCYLWDRPDKILFVHCHAEGSASYPSEIQMWCRRYLTKKSTS